MRIEDLIILGKMSLQKTKFSQRELQKMYENSNENRETNTYPPSTISSTIDTTPSKLSISALFSTFFLSI